MFTRARVVSRLAQSPPSRTASRCSWRWYSDWSGSSSAAHDIPTSIVLPTTTIKSTPSQTAEELPIVDYKKHVSTTTATAAATTGADAADAKSEFIPGRRERSSSEDTERDGADEDDREPHTGLLWFGNVSTTKVHRFDVRSLFMNRDVLAPKLAALFPEETTVKRIIPRPREGGFIVEFECPYRNAHALALEIETYVKQHSLRLGLMQRRVRCNEVQGKPFLDDLIARYPSTRLRIEFHGADLNEEQLFNELRPFGKIVDITIQPIVKDQVRTALVSFKRFEAAISARNCVHMKRIHFVRDGKQLSTKLYIKYDVLINTNALKDLITKNPRLMIPLLGILITLATILLFDPLRVFFIQQRLNHSGDVTIESLLSRVLQTVGLSKSTGDQYQHHHRHGQSSRGKRRRFVSEELDFIDPTVIPTGPERQEDIVKLEQHFHSRPELILFLTGAQGTGKSSMIRSVLERRKNTLNIDFDNFTDVEALLPHIEEEVNFFPSYKSLSALTAISETLMPGSKGALTGSTAAHLQKILECVTSAIEAASRKEVKQAARKARKAATEQEKQEILSRIEYPVIVVNGFKPYLASRDHFSVSSGKVKAAASGSGSILGGKDSSSSSYDIFEHILVWATDIADRNLAHVVFVTDSDFLNESMKSVMRGEEFTKTYDVYEIKDLSDQSTTNFLKQQLQPLYTKADGSELLNTLKSATPQSELDAQLQHVVKTIGGRSKDIQAFLKRIRSGSNIQETINFLVQEAIREIRRKGFGVEEKSGSKLKWTRNQVWETIKYIAEKQSGSAEYDDVLFRVFKGNEDALRALIKARIFTVAEHNSKKLLCAHSPLFLNAMQQMVNDIRLNAGMGILVKKAQIEEEQEKLSKVLDELIKLRTVSIPTYNGAVGILKALFQGESPAIAARRQMLESKVAEHTAKMEVYEREITEFTAVQQKYHQQQQQQEEQQQQQQDEE